MLLIYSFVLCVVYTLGQSSCNRPSQGNTVPGDNPCIHFSGRVYVADSTASFDWSGVQIAFTFEGTSLSLELSGGNENQYNVIIDGGSASLLKITTGNQATYTVAKGLTDGVHTALIQKRTEAFFGVQVLNNIILDTNKWVQDSNPFPSRKLEFIGDSITCGYGDEGTFPCSFSADTENNLRAYGALVGQHFNAEVFVESWSGKGMVRNYGDPNITSTDPFPSYYNKTLASPNVSPIWEFGWIPDGVVINLGTNDYSTQPFPPESVYGGGYLEFIARLRQKYGSGIKLFLVCGPMTGNPCCQYVQNVVSQAQPNVYYVDLQNILTSGDLGCDYHPNVNGHVKMAAGTIPVISKALNWA